jgi:hypothetical protein
VFLSIGDPVCKQLTIRACVQRLAVLVADRGRLPLATTLVTCQNNDSCQDGIDPRPLALVFREVVLEFKEFL